MSLVLNSGDEQREIKDENEIDDFRDYLLLNLVVSPEKKERTIFQIKQKLYEKLETNIAPLFQSIGISSFAMILFFKGKSLDKGGCIAQIEDITDGDIIYASEALGKPYIFKRFKEPNNTWFWCNNGCSADGIIFVPTQNVRICGFTCYAANQKDSYEMKYRVKIDNNSVEEDQITASGWEDKYYFRFRLKGIYDANAGSKIEFTVWIAENLQSQTEVRTYHGDCGDDYETYENEHMGLFKVESSSESDNGTGV